jgi:site-specific DNA recombinase
LPPVGTVLKREHGGRTIEVTVRATGFEYRHKVYSSLSQLAQQVTGTRWNGYHFFGLRKEWPGVSERERSIRCAIYTRKSTEEGLEQPFNTLQAQREAAEAYILSHRQEGWRTVPALYDDGGWSGASLERPALRKLLADIEARQIDCVVVYKVDRLGRSLLDFTRLLSLFEKRGVSFVSVTQDFNTSSSMGRLTLHILLSFAQFEREIIGERTRDKLSAARRKGKWIGGRPVLGYDVAPEGGRLVVNAAEAERVQEIFALCAGSSSMTEALQAARARGWTAKHWTSRRGRVHGGRLLSMSTLRLLVTTFVSRGTLRIRTWCIPASTRPWFLTSYGSPSMPSTN